MATRGFELQTSCISCDYGNVNIVQLVPVDEKVITFRISEQHYKWLNVYELSGCGFESRSSHLKQQSGLWL